MLNDNDAVTTWENKVDGNTVSQSSASQKPIFKTNIINGHPVVRFDGSNDELTEDTADMLDVNGLTGMTVFCVATNIADSVTDSFGTIISRDGSGDRGFAVFTTDSGDLGGTLVAITSSTRALRDTSGSVYINPVILTSVYDGATNALDIYVNGTLDNGGLSGSVPSSIGNGGDILRLGATGFGENFNGDVAEILVYNRALTGGELTTVTDALKAKYNIP